VPEMWLLVPERSDPCSLMEQPQGGGVHEKEEKSGQVKSKEN